MHVHFRGGDSLAAANKKSLTLYLAHGITTVRDAGGDLTPSACSGSGGSEMDAGLLAGPAHLHLGPKIDGPGATWPGSLEVETPAQIRQGARLAATAAGGLREDLRQQDFGRGLPRNHPAGPAARPENHRPHALLRDAGPGHPARPRRHRAPVLRVQGLLWQGRQPHGAGAQQPGHQQDRWACLPCCRPCTPPTARPPRPASFKPSWPSITRRPCPRSSSARRPWPSCPTNDHATDTLRAYIDPKIQATYAKRLASARQMSAAANAFRQQLNARLMSLVPQMQAAGVLLLAGSENGPFNSFA